MRNIVFIVLLCLCAVTATKAQPYGNEWINYSQKYWKFPVTQKGVYRISYTTLNSAGFPVNGISAKNIQMFSRGREIPIYIEGEADGIFNTTDFIEFYGEGNDGYLDSLIYDTPASQFNPYYSLFNDTAWYYISYNNLFAGNIRVTELNDTNYSSFTPLSHVFKQNLTVYNSAYYDGPRVIFGQGEPGYMAGEGYGSPVFTVGGNMVTTLNCPNYASSGGNAQLNYVLETDATGQNAVKVTFNTSNLLLDTTYSDFNMISRSYSLDKNLIATTNQLSFSSVAVPGASSTGRIGVGYVKLVYPHTLTFDDSLWYAFTLKELNSEANQRLDITGLNTSFSQGVFYDITNGSRKQLAVNAGSVSVLVPSNGQTHNCYLTSSSRIIQVSGIKLANAFGDNPGYFTDFASTLNGTEFLLVSHPKLKSTAMAYASYRTARGLPATYINVEELYEQFSHGINKHPLSVRRFSEFVLNQFPGVPQYLFLFGKAIVATSCRTNKTHYANSLIPTWGQPPSDNLLTASLNFNSWHPTIPTGRVAAKNETDAQAYFNKVKEFESNVPELWMKNILNFAGGSDINQQNELKGYLQSYSDSLTGPNFGGTTYWFSKTTSQPIQSNIPDSVRSLINNGVSIMNFFGHAAGSSFDVSIDYASNYNNQGKYPMIMANSCFAGDIHEVYSSSSPTTSEDWVLTANKGAIAFIAQVGYGIAGYLYNYTSNFYGYFSKENYGKGIGKSVQSTVDKLDNSSSDRYLRTTALEMTLHGDPSLVINEFDKPDYLVKQEFVRFNPAVITSSQDSFEVKVNVFNIGRAVDSTVQVDLKRTAGSAPALTFNKSASSIHYSKEFVYSLPTEALNYGGLNDFCVQVDPNNVVPELDDIANNKTCTQISITTEDIYPIYPYNYAIIGENKISLKASTGSPQSVSRSYTFEIDTTDLFNSAFRASVIITSSGGVVEWSLPFTLSDSVVYFWRVAYNDGSTNLNWKESSFQYIPQKYGWGQSHFFQYKENNFTFLDYNRNNRKLDFTNSTVNIECKTYGGSVTYASGYKIDNVLLGYAGCGSTPQIYLIVIDSLNFKPWFAWDNYGNHNAFVNGVNSCNASLTSPDRYFSFAPVSGDANGQQHALKMMIDTAVPNGYYMLFYTYVHGNFAAWTPELISYFNGMGSNVNNFLGKNPYIFFTRKGDQSVNQEVFGNSPTDIISLSASVQKNWNYGNMNSVVAGPSQSWKSLHWKYSNLEQPSSDSIQVVLKGLKYPTDEGVVIKTYYTSELDDYSLNTLVPASIYPYVKLEFFTSDNLALSPGQLNYWRLIHDDVPEAVLDPKVKLVFNDEATQAGDSVDFLVAVRNISDYPMDSLKINYWVINQNNQRVDIPYTFQKPLPFIRQAPLLVGDTMYTSLRFPNLDFGGNNSLWVEVNPNDDQPEKYHFNNIMQVPLRVEKDLMNPLLDVTFDGVHIMDGDIVSARPEVMISLKDENKFLAITDTSLFELSLLEPGQSTPKRLYFSATDLVRFDPAVLPDNKAKINYTPVYSKDGIYQLIVQGKDASGNRSGAFDYKINYEVITKSTLTEVLNYPNPFSTNTRFVFTLTGSEIPSTFRIQILTVSGKVVRDIDLLANDGIHIGRNITSYTWDGTDEFGDKLANGLYFYRVITDLNGQSIEKLNTEADAYFKKGLGKMYIMR